MARTGSKFPQSGASIFSVMTQLANQHGAINLAQGFPDFPVDARLLEIASAKLSGNVHQYQPFSGNAELLSQIGQLIQNSYQRSVDTATELLVTAGATEGLFAAIQALVHPGDQVVLLDPCYDSYETPIQLCGAVPVHVNLNSDYLPDWEKIDESVTEMTRMIVINTPHNPSGRMWREDDFVALEALLERHAQLIVLCDEVYEFIHFEARHLSIHSREKLRQRAISISSFGKTFHITGWKVGYVCAPEALMREIKQVHQFLVFSVNSVAQATLADYLKIADVPALSDFYRQKRDLFRNLMRDTRFDLLPCDGTYFQLASYENISDEPAEPFCRRLVTDYGVAAIPVSVFHHDGTHRRHIRFCFAKGDATLEQAAQRLSQI